MASGSNRSLPHHEIFDSILPESAFYLFDGHLSNLWSKECVKSLEVLTSCGSLLGITAEVRPMQFRNCLKNAAGNSIISTLKRFRAQLTHWVSDIQTHLINETSKGSNFDESTVAPHNNTVLEVHSHNTMSLSVLIRSQRFVKSGKEDQFSCLLRLGHLATQFPHSQAENRKQRTDLQVSNGFET